MNTAFRNEFRDKSMRGKIHRAAYLFSLTGLAVSMLFLKLLVSIFTLLLVLNFLAEGKYEEKWRKLIRHKALLLFLPLYGIHLLGLFWTQEMEAALDDLRIKAPLLALPVIIGLSRPLQAKSIRFILMAFVTAVALASLVGFSYWLNNRPFYNPREISLFISHIRFALMINLAIAILFYYSAIDSQNRLNRWQSVLSLVLMLWLMVFIMVLRSYTGILILLILLYGGAFIAARKTPGLLPRLFVIALLLAAGLSSAAWLSRAVGRYYYQEEVDPSTLEPYTAEGNPYAHKLEKMYYENGHPVNVYICEKELEREWEKRSGLDYYGTDRSGNSLRYTLIRYLASRGLRKDAKGVKALSKSDIDNIESGLANYIYADKRSVYPYVYNIIWQIDMYQKGYSPAGHSVGMRFVYMKAGWHIFSQHPWLGVGTGDVRQAFGQYYEQSPHHFSPKWRKLSHNQYLTFLAAFGFFGFLLCMLAILGPVFLRHAWGHMLVSVFMAIALLSMLNEDTLEPQIGVSFFAFFYSLFIFGGFHRKNET